MNEHCIHYENMICAECFAKSENEWFEHWYPERRQTKVTEW